MSCLFHHQAFLFCCHFCSPLISLIYKNTPSLYYCQSSIFIFSGTRNETFKIGGEEGKTLFSMLPGPHSRCVLKHTLLCPLNPSYRTLHTPYTQSQRQTSKLRPFAKSPNPTHFSNSTTVSQTAIETIPSQSHLSCLF